MLSDRRKKGRRREGRKKDRRKEESGKEEISWQKGRSLMKDKRRV